MNDSTGDTNANADLAAGMLGALLGSTAPATRAGQGGLDLGSLLQMLTSGAAAGGGEQASTTSADGTGGLASLLGDGGATSTSSKPKKPKKPKKPTSQSTASSQTAPSTGGGLGDLLSMLGGGQAASQQQQSSGGGLGDLLSMLGGGQAQAPSQSQQSMGGLGSLLSMFFGGQSASNSPLNGIASALGQQLGLPKGIAQLIISFVLGKLLGGVSGKGLNLSEVSGLLSSGGVDQRYVNATGLAHELAQQTGIDLETSSRGVTAFLNMMGGAQPATTVSATRRRPHTQSDSTATAAKPKRKR